MSSLSVSQLLRLPKPNQILSRTFILLSALVLLFSMSATAQEDRSEISIQGTGFYTKESNDRGIQQRPTDTGGFLVGYRYHINRWLAAETAYGFARNTQLFSLAPGTFGIQSDVHQATGGLVLNLPHAAKWRLNPYVLAEGGALVFNPTGRGNGFATGVDSQTRGVFVYGGGADYALSRHFLLRAEYRGLVYKTPDFGLATLNADAVTHTAQPSAGIVFRF
jgi:outer membrane immunogenic protein